MASKDDLRFVKNRHAGADHLTEHLLLPSSIVRLISEIATVGQYVSHLAISRLTELIAGGLPVHAVAIYFPSADGARLDLVAHSERVTSGSNLASPLFVHPFDLADDLGARFFAPADSPFVGHDRKTVNPNSLHGVIVRSLVITSDAKRPLHSTSRSLICLYIDDEENVEDLCHALDILAPVLACSIGQALRSDIVKFSSQATEKLAWSRDLDSFLHRIVALLTSEWRFGAASAFIIDERSKTLRLRGTTGIRNTVAPNERLFKHQVLYRMNDVGATTQAFAAGVPRLMTGEEYSEREPRYRESIELGGRTVALVPIVDSRVEEGQDELPMGVLRVVSSIGRTSQVRAFNTLSSHKVHLLTYVSRFIGSAAIAYGRATRVAEDFERSLHGIQSNLHFVTCSLNAVIERSIALRSIEPNHAHALPDSIDYVTNLMWQIQRYAGVTGHSVPNPVQVLLFRDVFAKLIPFVTSISKTYNCRREKGCPMVAFEERPEDIPLVKGDAEVYLTIFRNIVENAAKYSRRGSALKIHISWEIEESFLNVLVADDGIGIDSADVPHIFQEGYKAENAMRRCTIGAGIGLSQCKTMARLFGGDIVIEKLREPTTFRVKIPRWKEE